MDKSILKKLFPFTELENDVLEQIYGELTFETISYHKNDIILSNDCYECMIGFVLSGKCEVRRKRLKENILLQTLNPFDSFGILTLFSKEEYPTDIIAKTKTEILFIPKQSFLSCIYKHPEVCMNVMTFMASRIQFLNRKIAILSGTNVEEKVRQYIIFQQKEFGEQFTFNASQVSVLLNIGRASLYRVLDALQEADIIEVKEKIIFVKRPEALKG